MHRFRKRCSVTSSTRSAGESFGFRESRFGLNDERSVFVVGSKGFVEGRHVMKLRQQLQKHGYSHSFTTDEKGQLSLQASQQLFLFILK